MVVSNDTTCHTSSSSFAKHHDNDIPPSQPNDDSLYVPSSPAAFLTLIRRSLENQRISTEASDLIISAWRQGTIKQYKPYFERWTSYCRQRKIDPLQAAVADGLNFLASLFQSGSSYSAVNTACNALSSILPMQDNTKFGSHPLVSRLLKGVCEHRPSLPKYDVIWDVSVVNCVSCVLGNFKVFLLKT